MGNKIDCCWLAKKLFRHTLIFFVQNNYFFLGGGRYFSIFGSKFVVFLGGTIKCQPLLILMCCEIFLFLYLFENKVHISYLHNKSQCVTLNNLTLSPIVIVTALVDRIQVNSKIKIETNRNIKLSGFTSWVGKSSLEVTMKLEQEIQTNEWQHVLDAKFLMCARDTNNKGSALMNPLEVVTDTDRQIFQLGEGKERKPRLTIRASWLIDNYYLMQTKKENKKHRQNEAQVSLFNVPPNAIESLKIHDTFKSTIDLRWIYSSICLNMFASYSKSKLNFATFKWKNWHI